MKFYFLFFLFFAKLNAQQKINSVIQVNYSETITYRPTIVNNYDGILYIQNAISYYESSFINTERKSNNDDFESDEIVISSNQNKFKNEVFINKNTNEMTENLYEQVILKKSYSVSENIPKMKWVFLKGNKKINNFNCKKAQTTFRGRIYTAWYSEEIPVSVGPWKFNGLPGLIFSIEDADKIYKWEVKRINYPYKEKKINLSEIFKKRLKYKKVTFREYDELYITAIKDKISMINSRSASRESKSSFSFSTFQNKEPINEWRTKTEFK